MRRVLSSVAVLSVVVLAACSQTGPSPAAESLREPATAVDEAAPSAGSELAETTLCAELPSRETPFAADRLEGWWNATPADALTGGALADPADWGDARMREHPRVAVVDTQSGYWVTWDRTICGATDEYAPTIEPDWPPLSYVVVDIDSGELLESVEIADVDGGEGLATTRSVLATVLESGWVELDEDDTVRYSALVAPEDPYGLELVGGARVDEPDVAGGVFESDGGTGFSFRVQRGPDLVLGELLVFVAEPLEVDGGEGQTVGAPSWGFMAEALATGGECSVSVTALPAGTDVPPWPEGYADYLSTTVLQRLLATC
ncbi:hypothetical protein SAMN05216184_104153 [Georgenia satyanarayanai]|uniref:Uncharacterized protein n=1 Tax=Georgenia satyanarayanai TaxID=860221 RepID=A0A2Y9AB50_9MICO|nr:hypothetical protein [Georgenia satyanarayanai]PYG00213.1 hypothetical protein A8987_104153 [Georgenia satyanarayanai]SSA40468.1 hypothetical protein SAMN05216184_104153 [Georgenia satyanarayanai]